jgi:hypothetical protein
MVITFSTPFNALREIRVRLQAFLQRPFPTGRGTQTVLLRGMLPSQFSIIALTSGLSHAMTDILR